jgi:hypothetical protein
MKSQLKVFTLFYGIFLKYASIGGLGKVLEKAAVVYFKALSVAVGGETEQP